MLESAFFTFTDGVDLKYVTLLSAKVSVGGFFSKMFSEIKPRASEEPGFNIFAKFLAFSLSAGEDLVCCADCG